MSATTNETAGNKMGFREINARYLEPGSQWAMALGIVMLCQPWSAGIHSYGVTVILAGLIGFNVFSRISKPSEGK
jgi:hypothetical protein